jgi:hypothetical protein
MSRFERIQNSNKVGASNSQTSNDSIFGYVTDIILDDTHPLLKDENKYGVSIIGAVLYKSIGALTVDDKIAFPFDKNLKELPTRNEKIEIYKVISTDTGKKDGVSYYRRIGAETTQNFNAVGNELSTNFKQKANSEEQTSQGYNAVSKTGIENSSKSNENTYDGHGKYFQPKDKIHKLKLYEGDTILESRFSQSIRFSGYNNSENKFAPSIIIRNGENAKNENIDLNKTIEENIIEDGSIIAITSGEKELQFSAGNEDAKFETKNDSFKEYPTTLTGDQILINSGRIILSAKTAEMVFYSKKNYGFISDGALSIDNKFGATINLGDEFLLKTKDKNISLLGGNGKIFLNTTEETEPIARAATLVNILKDLINEIKKQQFLTPSGPSKIGPENVPAFDTILSKLDTIKSTLNFTE